MQCNKWIVIALALTIAQATKPMALAKPISGLEPQVQPAPLLEMSPYIIEEICHYLLLQDICRLRRTCRSLSNAWDHQQILSFATEDILKMAPSHTLSDGIRVLSKKLAKYQYRNPVALYLLNSNLTELSVNIRNLTHLRRLNLSGNYLTPKAISDLCDWLPNLEELILSGDILSLHYHLNALPANICKLTKLKRLDLTFNNLTPAEVTDLCDWLPNLEELILMYWGLSELPGDISKLKQLRRLNLSGNHLTLSAIVNLCDWLPNLEELDLSLCNLTELPLEISNLHNLKKLKLSHNPLSQDAKSNIKEWLPNTEILF